MEENYWDILEEVFQKALDQSGDERVAYLDQACKGKPELRSEIDEMLKSHQDDSALAVEKNLLAKDDLSFADHMLGTSLGSYNLLEVIGQGGMGIVYKAERGDGAFNQTVALKLIRRGFHRSEVFARFRQERQVLARLSHPHIVPLLDGGIKDGWPYLVMQYVEGKSITDYCDSKNLSINERLDLFKTVCKAVQHAHNNLVVHRDIKPSNILVTDENEVQLLDFGIAKLLDADQGEEAVAMTQSQIRLLTPEYASPEQVKGETITTASDVYGLGVLLFQLLTGDKPYQFANQSTVEIERVICEENPPRPSQLLGKSIGDLDNIVMMALRKEPERRYMSAGQLAEEIDRYLEGRPVLAQKDTLGYRVQKLLSRNKTGSAMAGSLMLLTLAFSVITGLQSKQVAEERDKAEEVSNFMMTLFKSADPTKETNDSLLVREVLDRGRDQLVDLEDKPATQLELMSVLSDAYWGLGLLEDANSLNESALEKSLEINGDNHQVSVDFMEMVGLLHANMGHHAKADSVFQKALPHFTEIYGKEDLRSVVFTYRMAFNMHALGKRDEADSLLTQLEPLVENFAQEDSEDLSLILTQLSNYYEIKGPLEKAMLYLNLSMEMKNRLHGPDDFRLLEQRNIYTRLLTKEGKLQEAQKNGEANLQALRDRFPDPHYILALGLEDLGNVYKRQEKYLEAEGLFLEALKQNKSIYHEEHHMISHSLGMLGILYHTWGKYEQAIDYYGQGLDLSRKIFPPHFPMTIARQLRLSEILSDADQDERAIELLKQSYDLSLEKHGPEYHHTKSAKKMLVELYKKHGQINLVSQLENQP